MKVITDFLHKEGFWPMRVSVFIAWKSDSKHLITIKINKVGLYIVRCNGTLVGTSINEDVITDMIKEKIWLKPGNIIND